MADEGCSCSMRVGEGCIENEGALDRSYVAECFAKRQKFTEGPTGLQRVAEGRNDVLCIKGDAGCCEGL